jgi:hypothetical protein
MTQKVELGRYRRVGIEDVLHLARTGNGAVLGQVEKPQRAVAF